MSALKELGYHQLSVGVMEPLNYTRNRRNDPYVRLAIDGNFYKLSGDLAAQLGRRLTDYAKIAKAEA